MEKVDPQCGAVRGALQLASMTEPQITTVIPTYRRPQMLRRAIRSVLNQTFPHFRVCIYDDASGDETEKVAEEFCRTDPRVEYFRRPENIGRHANLVDGANRVRTPFFSWLTDDDFLLPDFFEGALKGFREHPEAVMSVLATLHTTPRGFIRDALIMDWPKDGLIMPPDGALLMMRHGIPNLITMLVRHELWMQSGGWDEATDPCTDFEFELRVAALRPIVVSRQPGGIQLIHSGSNTAGVGLHWVWPPLGRIISTFETLPIPSSRKPEVMDLLERSLRRSLMLRGGLLSIRNCQWVDTERAADLLEQRCGLARQAALLRRLTAICRRLPLMRVSLHLLIELRNWYKAVRNLGLWWRFRRSIHLLDDLMNAAS